MLPNLKECNTSNVFDAPFIRRQFSMRRLNLLKETESLLNAQETSGAVIRKGIRNAPLTMCMTGERR